MIRRILAVACASMFIAVPAFAAGKAKPVQPSSTEVAFNDLVAFKAAFSAKYPKTSFSSITPTPVPGIYEVVTGKNIIYADKTASYFFMGSLLEVATQRDLTEERRAEIRKIDFSKYIDNALVTVKGDGSRKLYVFSDPDCPWCRRLEGALDGLDNVTIYTFMISIPSLHPEAQAKAEKIWCTGDNEARLKAWRALMIGGDEPVGSSSCGAPISANMKMAEQAGVSGTPVLVRADGARLPGFKSRSAIDSWLGEVKK